MPVISAAFAACWAVCLLCAFVILLRSGIQGHPRSERGALLIIDLTRVISGALGTALVVSRFALFSLLPLVVVLCGPVIWLLHRRHVRGAFPHAAAGALGGSMVAFFALPVLGSQELPLWHFAHEFLGAIVLGAAPGAVGGLI
jgi:hypothetical protein